MATRPCEHSVRVFGSSLGRRAFWKTLCFLLVALSMVLGLSSRTGLWPIQIAMVIGAIGSITWLVWGSHYHIENGTLTVRRLYFRKRIALREIKAVRRRPYPVWHGWRGDRDYALGTKAIEIELAGSQVLVSPKDEDGFLAALGRSIEHID